MPPKPAPRDDDDVVEDYEVFDEQPSAKMPASKSGSKPAAGAPVMRKQPSVAGGRKPSAPVRPGSSARPAVPAQQPYEPAGGEGEEPPVYDPNKGKISAKSAKQIWIICIGITVLGLGAVGADLALDPFGRRGNSAASNANNRPKNTPKTDNRPKDAVGERAENFKRTVEMEQTRLMQKKPYKFYRDAYHKFRNTRSAAFDAKADEKSSTADRQKAWAEVYRDYFAVQYAKNLFLSVYREGVDGFEPISMRDEESRLNLAREKGDEILKEPIVRLQAAAGLVDAWSSDINEFWTGLRKGDHFVAEVLGDDKWKPVFKAAKEKYEKSQGDPPVFDQADIDAIKE